MQTHNRAVITGMGILAPNGIGLKAFWRSLVAGQSGIGPITLFDATGYRTRIAGEVKGFDPLDYMPAQWKPKRMARHTQLAFAATQLALQNANFDPATGNRRSVFPVYIGVSTSALDVIENGLRELRDGGPRRVNSGVVSNGHPQAVARLIAEKLGVQAQATTISSACQSGIEAIAMAATRVIQGEVEIALAGGADAPITPLTMASLASAGLSSFANAEPQRASRPYDQGSDSGVISEGAGVVVVESLEHAIARGARIYLEIKGYASQMDHDPCDPFVGLECAMRLALANACLQPNDIDYICAYGPGHPILDAAEAKVIRRVFGSRAGRVPVSSIKGVTGNPLSATGPFQLITCALTFQHDTIPPTTNHETPLPGCDLDFVPRKARKALVKCALINVRGLGGGNSSMVVQRFESNGGRPS